MSGSAQSRRSCSARAHAFVLAACKRERLQKGKAFKTLGSFSLQLYRDMMGWPGFKHGFKEKNCIGTCDNTNHRLGSSPAR